MHKEKNIERLKKVDVRSSLVHCEVRVVCLVLTENCFLFIFFRRAPERGMDEYWKMGLTLDYYSISFRRMRRERDGKRKVVFGGTGNRIIRRISTGFCAF